MKMKFLRHLDWGLPYNEYMVDGLVATHYGDKEFCFDFYEDWLVTVDHPEQAVRHWRLNGPVFSLREDE